MPSHDYERIARVIRYLDAHRTDQPDLERLAVVAGLSRYHLNRLFTRWAGVTPKRFLQHLTLAHARTLLRKGDSVLDTALETGLSGPGRLHDLCVTLEAASPGEIKSGGAGWTLEAGFSEGPFGLCLVAQSPRGICHLSFVDQVDRRRGAEILRESWPRAEVRWTDAVAKNLVDTLMAPPATRAAASQPPTLRACVRGSAFQLRVWRALLQVPPGTLTTYGRLASALGQPAAARAVGSAVARNTLAYLIPCHRVIRETGAFGDYRWDPIRKRALIAWESSRP